MHEARAWIRREVSGGKDVGRGSTGEPCHVKGGLVPLLRLAEVGDEVAWRAGYDILSVKNAQWLSQLNDSAENDQRIEAGSSRHARISCQTMVARELSSAPVYLRPMLSRDRLTSLKFVLHELPVEVSFFDPREIILHSIPVYSRGSEDVLLVHFSILSLPADIGNLLGI